MIDFYISKMDNCPWFFSDRTLFMISKLDSNVLYLKNQHKCTNAILGHSSFGAKK